jgi:hypothetical protein
VAGYIEPKPVYTEYTTLYSVQRVTIMITIIVTILTLVETGVEFTQA